MQHTERLVSLDAFRGLTILLMIIVNTPGSWSYVYAPLRHSEWHGATPTDLVFPFFLFIMGVAMWFSLKKYDYRPTAKALKKIAKRTLLIFLIGLLLNAFPTFNWSHLRIMGVLQRIALAYGLAALWALVLPSRTRWLLAVLGLLGYWAAMYYWGGHYPYSLEDNAATHLDVWLFGSNHVYHGFGIAFDPEGLLSTWPAAISVMLGFLTGQLITNTPEKLMLLGKLVGLGVLAIVVGLLWNPVFPINKPIWSSSYVLYTYGVALLVLSVFIWVVDVMGAKKWTTPLLIYGTNPLLIFVLSIVWVKVLIYWVHVGSGNARVTGYGWLYNQVFVPLAGNMVGSLLFALAHGLLFWAVGLVLYKKKIFLKI